MLKHHLLLAFRNFKQNKSSFFINLIGLSSGLACAIFIYLWVNDELHVDKFHEKDARLYQVRANYQFTESVKTNFETDGPLAKALADEMPEVEYAVAATPVYWFEKFTLSANDNNQKATGKYAEKDFFNIFSYDLIQGDKDHVLSDKNSIVISRELAMKLFHTTKNVIGREIEFQHKTLFLVSGVFEGTPPNSTEQFDFVLPFINFQEEHQRFAQWDQRGPSTYLVLSKGTDIEAFDAKINRFYRSKINESNISLFVTRYSDDYLYGNYENGVQAGGRIEYVILFSIIAVFILIIACINFMNLSTAKATQRAKEIGIKKAIGVDRKNLVFQYLSESLLMTGLSLIIAILFVALFLPLFNDITAKSISLRFSYELLLSLLGIVLFTGLLSGSYPALYLSGFNPVAVFKGNLRASIGELWARRGLVVFQFTLSIVLIVGVWVVYKQIQFVQDRNIGYDKDNIICFDMEGKVKEDPEVFLNEVKRLPGIKNASTINSRLTGSYGATSGLNWKGKDPDDVISFEIVQVNYDMIETLGIDMVTGRTFSRQYSSDRSKLIFNEAAIEAMGLEDPVGEAIDLWGMKVQILGVCKNFHINSLHEKVKPLFFRLLPEHTDYVMVKIAMDREREAIEGLRNFYQAYNPGFILDYKFLDDNYQKLYESEQRVADLSKYFAGLAILISCLGLFGLAAFTTQRRLKEISIRKILGSSDFGIVSILSKDFTRMVLIAIVIALPISYFITERWLSDFAYRIDLEWWYFGMAGLIALLIAWFTVGLQTLKAASVNPTESLKEE